MTGLALPVNGITNLIDHVASYGRQNVETGALLMCQPDTDVVQVLALAGVAGVTRRYGLFVLSMPVIDRAFTYAEDRGLRFARRSTRTQERRSCRQPTSAAT